LTPSPNKRRLVGKRRQLRQLIRTTKMASQQPAQSERENQQQGETNAGPQQTGTPLAPQYEQQQELASTPIFRDFASI
jgi:hypothetical protein